MHKLPYQKTFFVGQKVLSIITFVTKLVKNNRHLRQTNNFVQQKIFSFLNIC